MVGVMTAMTTGNDLGQLGGGLFFAWILISMVSFVSADAATDLAGAMMRPMLLAAELFATLIVNGLPVILASAASWALFRVYRWRKRYPVSTFGKRYYETERSGEVDMCVNCNSSDDDGVVTTGWYAWVVLGAPVWLLDHVRIGECSTCASIDDALDYALRAGAAQSVSEIGEMEMAEELGVEVRDDPDIDVEADAGGEGTKVSLDARDRDQPMMDIISGGHEGGDGE